jgi:hypothetical protein
MFKTLVTGLALLSIPFGAGAHYLWIEVETPAEIRVFFGEFNENVREKSGDRLDERDSLKGWIKQAGAPDRPLVFTKKADHFSTVTDQKEGWILVQDVEGDVKDWTNSGIGIVKPMFYSRAALGTPGNAEPALPLDVVPDPSVPDSLCVYFKKQPLPNAKLLIYAPNLWMQELKTDDQGRVKISTPWPGRYVIDCIHKEPVDGEFKGVKYEAIRHRAVFSALY